MTILAENRLNTIIKTPYGINYKFPIHPLKAEEFRQAMPNAPRDNISRKGALAPVLYTEWPEAGMNPGVNSQTFKGSIGSPLRRIG